MIFEGDAQNLQAALDEPDTDHTEFGDIIRMIVGLQRCWENYTYVSVRRERNQVAYNLARKSIFHTSPLEGHVPPQNLVDGVAIMCSENHH
ncbi:hypothetical protein LINGRAHAP2_LOCUS24847 [Linum grandiflorum]